MARTEMVSERGRVDVGYSTLRESPVVPKERVKKSEVADKGKESVLERKLYLTLTDG